MSCAGWNKFPQIERSQRSGADEEKAPKENSKIQKWTERKIKREGKVWEGDEKRSGIEDPKQMKTPLTNQLKIGKLQSEKDNPKITKLLL